jgi:hypothetical protein
MVRTLSLIACAALLVLPATARSQSWRSLTIDREVSDSVPLNIAVAFAEGNFELRKASAGAKLSLALRYDADRVNLRYRFDSTRRLLSLSSEKVKRGRMFASDELGDARLELPASVPANLSVDLGASTADLDLGGLSLRTLTCRAGASVAWLRFAEPNVGVMDELNIDGSAGTIRATELANTRAARINVQAHLGVLDLDFGGRWSSDMSVVLKIVLASATLRVPRNVGVQIRISPILSSFSTDGFMRVGDTYRSDNWEEATHRLTLDANSILGRLNVVRTAPAG